MKTNDLKKQLAAVMAVALTFSSVPVVSADNSLFSEGDSAIVEELAANPVIAVSSGDAIAQDGVIYVVEGDGSGTFTLADTVEANTTTWTSSNPDIVSIVEDTGVATIEKDAIGEVTITATNGSDQESRITVVVLDKIGYSFSVGENATAEEQSGGLAVEVADTSNTNLITDAINGLITAGKLKLDFTGKSESTRAITADDYTIAVSEIGKDEAGKVTVTVPELSADAAKIFSLTGTPGPIYIKVDQAKTKVTPVIPTGATVDVAVFESDDKEAREGKVAAAIKKAINDKKLQLESGSTKLETEFVSATPKDTAGETARTTYTVVAKVPNESAGKYTFEGGYNNATGATGDVTINYVASKAKVTPTVALTGEPGTKNSPVTVTVPRSATTSEENDKIATAVKDALTVNTTAEDEAFLTVDKDYRITVSKKETGIYTATFALLNDKYQINPDTAATQYSVDVYVNVKKEATPLTTFTAALTGGNAQTVSVKKGATLAEKEAAAIKQIEEKLVITTADSNGPVSLTKGTDYSVEIKATKDDKTAFTVTVKLINKTDYSGSDPDPINVTVTYSEEAEIVEIKTITPVIGGVESGKGTKYPVNILATDGDSAKTAKAQKALEDVLTLSGVDGLVKGTDYTYEITIDFAKDTATATFTLVSKKYKIDSSVSKNNVVTKTVDINFVVAAEEVSPKLALKDKAAAEKTFYVSENASVDSLKSFCTDYVINGGWAGNVVSGNSAYEVKDAGKLKADTDYTIKNDAYVYNSKNNTATVTVTLTLKNTTDYALASDAVTELVFTFKFEAKKEIKVSDPKITCASPLSCNDSAKKSAFADAKVKAAVEKQLTDAGLTINTAEAAGDFEVSVAASTAGYTDSVSTAATATIKLLDGDKYAIADATSGPTAVPNSTAVTYTLTCYYTNTPLTATTKITPVVTAPKSVEVEVLPTDDDAARSKKAIEQITSETTYVVYGADRSDITSTLVKDTDYTLSVVDNKTLSPSATVTFAIKNTTDYESANIAEDAPNKKPAINASLTATVKITYVEKETNTDKWVKNEDGTYSYTISYASTEEKPVKDGTLKLDLGDADLEKVSNITAVLTVTGEGAYAGGCLGATDAAKDAAESGKGWVTANWSSEDADKNGDITVSLDVDGVTEDSAELQLWWAGKDTTVTLKEVKVSTEEAATKPEITKIFGDVNRVGINWSEVKGATGYGVFVKANGKWSRYCMTGKDTLGKYVKDLKPGTKYAFAVKAYVDGKWTDIASEDIKTATPLGAVPVITKAKALTGKVELNWAETKNATGYAVWVKDGKTWTRFCMTGKAARGKYVTGLKAGSKYAIAVKAYVDGKWTDVTSDTYVTVTAK